MHDPGDENDHSEPGPLDPVGVTLSVIDEMADVLADSGEVLISEVLLDVSMLISAGMACDLARAIEPLAGRVKTRLGLDK